MCVMTVHCKLRVYGPGVVGVQQTAGSEGAE